MSGGPNLDRLLEDLPLSPHWSRPEVFSETGEISGATFHLIGLSTQREASETICGSAAALDGVPVERAYFELLERASLLDATVARQGTLPVLDEMDRVIGHCDARAVFPESPPGMPWRYARSNGVAAHRTWARACEAAKSELVERDRVLRSWFGASVPRVVSLPDALVPGSIEAEYEVTVCTFGSGGRHTVGGVLAFPRDTKRPLACGFSAGLTLELALRGAARECMQTLAFLWGKSLPAEPPPVSADPGYHQEYYLFPEHHAKLRAWLAGDRPEPRSKLTPSPRLASGYVDLTPDHLGHRMRVAKALPEDELPLTFGVGHPNLTGPTAADFAVHPIA